MRRMWQAEEGMTLIEIMVATVVTAIVVTAAMTIVMTSNKATQVNEQAADVQQNVRLAMELISQDIKLAGFNMTSAVGACAVGPLALPAPIVPGDNVPGGAVGVINDVGPDHGEIGGACHNGRYWGRDSGAHCSGKWRVQYNRTVCR